MRRLGVLFTVAAIAVLLAVTLSLWQADQRTAAGATATVTGEIVQAFSDDGLDVAVEWTDPQGGVHRDEFYLYESADAAVGKSFTLRYNPQEPGGSAFTADPDVAQSPGEDPFFTGVFGALTGLLLLLAWLWRSRAVAAADSRSRTMAPVRMRMLVLDGNSNNVECPYAVLLTAEQVVSSPREQMLTHLDALSTSGGWDDASALEDFAPTTARYQRLLFHPTLDAIAADVTDVSVYADLRRQRRAVIHLPNGEALTPLGWLRRNRPRMWTFRPRTSVLSSVRADLVRAASAGEPRSRQRLAALDAAYPDVAREPSKDQSSRPSWQTALLRNGWFALPGLLPGFVIAGPLGAVTAATCFALLGGALWAWYGGDAAT